MIAKNAYRRASAAIKAAYLKSLGLYAQTRHATAKTRDWLFGLIVAFRTGVHPEVAKLLKQGAATQSELRKDQQSIASRLTEQENRMGNAESRINLMEQRLERFPEEIRAIVREAIALRPHISQMLSFDYQLSPGRTDTIPLPAVNLAGLINPRIITELDIAGGANNDLKLCLTDPHGRRIDDFGQTYSGRFETPVLVSGTYSLYLDNTMSWVSTKVGLVKVSLEYETLGSGQN